MGKITGLGGVFIKANDPKALADWYEQNLGIDFNGNSYVDLPFADADGKPSAGSNVFSIFTSYTKYFDPSENSNDQFAGRGPVWVAGGIKKEGS